MDVDTIKYLINNYLNIVPIEIISKLKYPYLKEYEVENEKKRIAEIILRDYSDKVFLNNCPKCGKLARTPKAKQCRFCEYNWH